MNHPSNRLIIFDTTLRDGEQSPGASMTKDEKVRIAKQLEKMKVDVIEAGFAAASNGDFESIKAIAQVVRGFADADVVHVDGKVDAKADIDTINTELILADLETLEKARARIEKELKGKKADPAALDAVVAAANGALAEAEAVLEAETTKITGGVKVPGVPG